MIKKSNKYIILLLIISFGIFYIAIDAADATSNNTTLKDLKDKLAEDQAKINEIDKEKDQVANKIKNIEDELSDIEKDINECDEKITEAQNKIEELNEYIIIKQ